MNVITLTGNATKDIELSYSPSGTGFGKGTIAVQRNFKNQQGEYDTDFINFKAIGKISEVMANYIQKGDKFGITGSLQINVSEKDGKKRYFTEVVVSGFDFPNKPKGQSGNNQQSQNNNQQQRQKPADENPFANNGQPINISDSDLPF
jgi:single-strand DNA-binding protein